MSTPSGSRSTTPRRRASARGHNGGRSGQDAETVEIKDKVTAQAHEQAQKMKKVTEHSLERALARTRVEAALSLDKATKDALHDTLSEPLIPQPTCSTNLMPTPSTTPVPAMGTELAATTTPSVLEKDDETWNKSQIMYVFVLTSTVGLVFLLQPLLPTAYARWIIMLIAVVWGLGSIGLPCGLYGTSRCEMEFSRHTGRLIYTMFSVLVIYGFYLLAMSVDGTSAPAPSMSVKESDHTSNRNADFWWTFWFGAIGLTVLLGNLWSSVRECWTGGRSSCPRQALPATVAAAPPSPGPSEPPPPSRGRTPVWASAIRGVSNTIGLLLFVVVVVPLATHCTSKDEVFTCVFLSAMAIAFPAQGYVFTWDQP